MDIDGMQKSEPMKMDESSLPASKLAWRFITAILVSLVVFAGGFMGYQLHRHGLELLYEAHFWIEFVFTLFFLVVSFILASRYSYDLVKRIVSVYAQLQQSREDQTRLKRELTQNISHELKTPVSSIQGFLETILQHPEMSEEQRNTFLQRCYAQSTRLTNLLQDISTLNRMDASAQNFDKETLNLSQLVLAVKSDTALQAKDKKMSFINLLPDNLVLKGNQLLIYSIFRNLTDNAIAYAGEGSTINLRLIEKPDDATHYHFSFADNGPGVPEEHLPRLFERFYRVDKGRSRKLGGTGLGLAIVKNAVLIHGGTIRAQKNAFGGLEFVFSLSKG